MKNKILSISVIFIILMITLITFSYAEEADSNAQITTIESTTQDNIMLIDEHSTETPAQTTETLNEDFYFVGTDITLDVPVNGNVFIFANNVLITSNISGNVFVSASNITTSKDSTISGSLFANSTNITIEGLVSDVYAYSENINISGFIYRDLKANVSNLNISGSIGKDIFANISKSLDFNNTTNIPSLVTGNFNYSSATPLNIPEGIVLGDINFSELSVTTNTTLTSLVTFVTLTLLIYILYRLLNSKFLEKANLVESKKIFTKLFLGFIIPLAILILSVIFFFIPLTTTLGIIGICILIILYLLSIPTSIILLATSISVKLEKTKNIFKYSFVIAISLIISLLSLIPYLGIALTLFLLLYGIGSIIYYIFKNRKESI